MLKSLRKNTKIIIWAVIICFALWGGFSVSTQFQKRGRIAGEVFGKDVSFQEYNLFYRASQIFNFGSQIPQNENSLRQQTWQSILYAREARRQKIEISDEEVRQEILELLEGHQITDPSPTVYQNWLAVNLRETAQEFESQIREILRIQKLVRKINSEPVERTKADEHAARLKFRSEYDLLSAEMLLFSNVDEARAFREKVKTADDWKKKTQKMSERDRLKTPPMISLGAWTRDFKVPEDAVWRLHRLEKGIISEPVRVENEYAVFLILDQYVAPEDKFESTLKEDYLKEFEEQKKYERFAKWHLEVQKKANLKDHLPPLESPQPEPEPETPPSPSNLASPPPPAPSSPSP